MDPYVTYSLHFAYQVFVVIISFRINVAFSKLNRFVQHDKGKDFTQKSKLLPLKGKNVPHSFY